MQIEEDKELSTPDVTEDEEVVEEELLAEEEPPRSMRGVNIVLGVVMALFLVFTVLSVWVILHEPPSGVTEDSIYQGFIPMHALLHLPVF